MKKIRVTVTKEHIDKGTPHSSTSCPIALAMKEQFPNAWQVKVYSAFATVDLKPEFKSHFLADYYTLSERAIVFVTRFDAGMLVKPETFELEEE